MKQTFDQTYKNELMFKNNPDKYKLLKQMVKITGQLMN